MEATPILVTSISHSKLTLDLTDIMYRPYRPWEVSAALGLEDPLVMNCCIRLWNTLHELKERLSSTNNLVEANLKALWYFAAVCTYICTDLFKLAFY